VSFDEGVVTLAAGDMLLLFTDGITEATDAQDELYGDDRLAASLETRRQFARAEFASTRSRRRTPVRRLHSPVRRPDNARHAIPRSRRG
jgi:hypothetical protein